MSDPLSTTLDRCAQGWGAWMLEMSWQLGVVVAVVALATWLARHRSARFTHALWLLVLCRLVVPPFWAFPTGWGWWLRSPVPLTAQTGSTPGASPVALPGFPPFESIPRSESGGSPEPVVLSRDGTELSAGSSVAGDSAGGRWLSYLMLAWGGVALTLLGFLAAGSFRVWTWVQSAEPIDDPELYALLKDCQRRVGFPRPVELRNSESCTTPVVVGQYRPTILIPRAVLQELSRDELRGVLLHELHHLQRGDAIVNLLQGVLTAVYFFHPLVWWANARIRESRELACDEATLQSLPGGQRVYGGAIVKVTEIFGYASPPLALGIMESKSPTRRRLERILAEHIPARLPGWQTMFLWSLLGLVLIPGAAATDQTSSGGAGIAGGVGQERNDSRSSREQGWRYRFQPGDSLSYRISVEADVAHDVSSLEGTSVWHVQSTDPLGTRLTMTGGLRDVTPPRLLNPLGPHVPPGAGFRSFGPGPFDEPATVDVDPLGVVHRVTGDAPLPWLLGELTELVFIPLPTDSAKRWTVNTEPRVPWVREAPDDRLTAPRGFPPFGPSRRREVPVIPCRQNAVFAVLGRQGDRLQIERTTTLITADPTEGTPRMKLEGQTIVEFDLRRNLVASLTGRFRWTRVDGVTEEVVPFRLKVERLVESESPVPPAATSPGAPTAAGVAGVDEQALDRALADLRTHDVGRVQRGAQFLDRQTPGARRDEVVDVLRQLLTDEQAGVRKEAVRLLGTWGDAGVLPALRTAALDPADQVSAAALVSMARIGGESAARDLVDLANQPTLRIPAIAALRRFGPEAEPAVVDLLASSDWTLRNDACLILHDLGTPRSRVVLEECSRADPQSAVRQHAVEALVEIERRAASKAK